MWPSDVDGRAPAAFMSEPGARSEHWWSRGKGETVTDEIELLLAEAYERRRTEWEHAIETVRAWLTKLARDLLAGGDMTRLAADHARVKDQGRALDKLRRSLPEDGSAPASASDIEETLPDIAGVKVLCKSPRDQRALVRAIEENAERDGVTLLKLKDYIREPKQSGYRAFHVHLQVDPPGVRRPVAVEVQVKTRLQDSWSELTHEDLYKPGGAMKPSRFHGAVARQMAALLAAVDDLADDLAGELEAAAAGPSSERLDDADAHSTEVVTARVRTSGPRYALAVDGSGRQGLISAQSVRDQMGLTTYINVDDYIQVGQEIQVRVQDDEEGTYFYPVSDPRSPD